DRIAVGEPEAAVALELLDEARRRSRKENVVRVEPAEVLATGAREALVERVRLSTVGFARPPREAILVPPDDLYASVRRAAVHHDELDRLVVLLQHRADRLLQEGRLVERRRHDRHQRR